VVSFISNCVYHSRFQSIWVVVLLVLNISRTQYVKDIFGKNDLYQVLCENDNIIVRKPNNKTDMKIQFQDLTLTQYLLNTTKLNSDFLTSFLFMF
jgi:hypothetical protein